jgi:CRISPR/Cas system CMR-associated protein Cmr5 small subunit
MLGIEQKKGDPNKLLGRLVVYAKIAPNADTNNGMGPLKDMIKNNLLAVSGEFKDTSFKDFIHREMSSNSNSEGFAEFIEHLKEEGVDLPEGMDPESIRDRVQEITNMEIIPVPAKVIFYESEEEILKEDADIFYIGEFSQISQAHLCITSLPIFYQAMYREQVYTLEIKYIDDLLKQIETNGANTIISQSDTNVFDEFQSLGTFMGDLFELLSLRVIPFLLAIELDEDYEKNVAKFYSFMSSYPEIEDVVQMDHALRSLRENHKNAKIRERLELISQKMSAVYQEDSKKALAAVNKLKQLDEAEEEDLEN